MEAARRASIADEEARKMRAVELAIGVSSSKNVEIAGGTADSAIDVVDTNEGVLITEVVRYGEPDPQSCRSSVLCAPSLFHLPLLYFNFFYVLGTIACLFVGGGVNGK